MKALPSSHRKTPTTLSTKVSASQSDKAEEYDPKDFNLSPEEAKMFDVQQVYVFSLNPRESYEIVLEEINNEETYSSSSSHFDLDERLIDSDMLMAEAAEADRIYLELKERSLRTKRAAVKE